MTLAEVTKTSSLINSSNLILPVQVSVFWTTHSSSINFFLRINSPSALFHNPPPHRTLMVCSQYHNIIYPLPLLPLFIVFSWIVCHCIYRSHVPSEFSLDNTQLIL